MQCIEVPRGHSRATIARNSFGYHQALASTLGLLATLAACSGEYPTTEQAMPTASAVRAAVTGLAADAIGANGQIQLAPPVSGGEPELTASEAVSFATAWMRDYAPMTRSWLESTHGATLNLKTLQSCGRPL